MQLVERGKNGRAARPVTGPVAVPRVGWVVKVESSTKTNNTNDTTGSRGRYVCKFRNGRIKYAHKCTVVDLNGLSSANAIVKNFPSGII